MSKKRVRNHVNPLSITREVSFEGFGNDRPIVVDIGAYRGEFIADMAEKFPEQNYMAFEVRRKVTDDLHEKFAEYSNIEVFGGDACRNFRSVLEPCINEGAQIKEIYNNFPDPWFKAKHHKRRVISRRFLESVREWIPADTTWVYQTDQRQIFEETKELLDEMGIVDREYFDESPYGIQTKWEKSKLGQGLPVYRMKFWIR